MTGVRGVLFSCLTLVSAAAWAADTPGIPAGARIGIIDFVRDEIIHYHVGTPKLNSFLRTYRANWDTAELIDGPLISSLTSAGFQPTMTQPTDELRDERQSWLVDNPHDRRLPRKCMRELERILEQQNLSALIIVAPGANDEPAYDERERLAKLPKTTRGFGFSTSDEPDGITRPAVFDFTQMVVVARTEDGPELVLRDWGGDRLYEWPGFDPGADLKALSNAQVAPLRPLFTEVMQQRILRLMSALKP